MYVIYIVFAFTYVKAKKLKWFLFSLVYHIIFFLFEIWTIVLPLYLDTTLNFSLKGNLTKLYHFLSLIFSPDFVSPLWHNSY